MHEMAIVDNLLAVINEQVKEHRLKQVSKVYLLVGELTGVVPDVLRFCWQVCTENTPYEGAQLHIDKIPAVALCRSCAAEYAFTQGECYSCPHCGGAVERIVSGKELYIDHIEGE